MRHLAAVTGAFVLAATGTAHGDGGDPDVDAGKCKVSKFCIGVGTHEKTEGNGEQADAPARSESKVKCELTKVSPAPPAKHPAWKGANPKKNTLYFRACTDGSQDNADGFVVVPRGKPAPKVDPQELAQRAVDSMTLLGPDININPKPGGKGLVGMPVWMAIDPSATTWGPNSASASAGGVTVTATAKVSKVVWTMGDGKTVTCNGPGTVYQKSFGFKKSPDCGHVYTRPSSDAPGGKYPVTATTTWDIGWQATGAAATGQLTEVRDSQVTLTIVESQAVNQ